VVDRFARVFFFQAEDGIRDFHVTGVQTCALPICLCVGGLRLLGGAAGGFGGLDLLRADGVLGGVRGVGVLVGSADGAGGVVLEEIGRASCRESVDREVVVEARRGRKGGRECV